MPKPFFDKSVLFEAGQGGYTIYRIPCIVATMRDTLLAFCEARKSARGDWGQIDILMRRSTDGGRTWDAPRPATRLERPVPKNPLALEKGLAAANEQCINNPVAIVARSGAVHFLHCVEYARCYYLRSDDDGLTWSDPKDITATFEAFRPEYDWKVLATGPGHSIQLRNGRLIVPVWLSTGTGGHAHRPSCVSVIYSDDQGTTWQRGEIVVRDSDTIRNPSETVALELLDGRVMLNIRSESRVHRRFVSISADGATGWSEPTYDDALWEPVCCASLIRLSTNPSRILFVNPDSRHLPPASLDWGAWPRENLTARLSLDEAKTWPISRIIDPGVSGYSDLAVASDGTIYCLYEGGGLGGNMFHVGNLTLARFNLEWLTD